MKQKYRVVTCPIFETKVYNNDCVLVLNWAHRSMDQHITHKIDHTIYSAIEEWNSAKMLATMNAFINQKQLDN